MEIPLQMITMVDGDNNREQGTRSPFANHSFYYLTTRSQAKERDSCLWKVNTMHNYIDPQFNGQSFCWSSCGGDYWVGPPDSRRWCAARNYCGSGDLCLILQRFHSTPFNQLQYPSRCPRRRRVNAPITILRTLPAKLVYATSFKFCVLYVIKILID